MKLIKVVFLSLIIASIFIVIGCGTAPSGSGGDSSSERSVVFSGSKQVLSFNDTVDIQVAVVDKNNNIVDDFNDTATIELSDENLGYINTDDSFNQDDKVKLINGTGTFSFTSSKSSGTVNINVVVNDNISGSYSLNIAGDEKINEVSRVVLSMQSNQVAVNQKALIDIELFTYNGSYFQDSKTVNFVTDNPVIGKIQSPVTVQDGKGTAEFAARDVEGSANITASVDNESTNIKIVVTENAPAANISVSANPEEISASGTSNIKTVLTDSEGNPVEDGTEVTFELDNPDMGTIKETASTFNGQASATFIAGNNSGMVEITASSGGVSDSISLKIAPPEEGNIEFVSAEPSLIGLKGTDNTSSTVKFAVRDVHGDLVTNDVNVYIEVLGPGGGECVGSNPCAQTTTVSTVDGIATVILQSGTVPGPVTLNATIENTDISTSSGAISIGGGAPSASHFSLSTEKFNLEGLAYDNIQTNINTLLADRYGNYNIMEGTTVSYYSECGAIDRSVNLDNIGAGTVTFRTQSPSPVDTTIDPYSTKEELIAENSFYNAFKGYFGTYTGGNPRDGLCTVTAVVNGEEKFYDSNGNGKYDAGENFIDTVDDIFVDSNDDNEYSPDEDLVSETLKNGAFDGKNGIWDSNKKIFKNIKLLMTGQPMIFTDLSNGFHLSAGESDTFHVFVGDKNLNRPIAGTTYEITAGSGDYEIIGPYTGETYTFSDSNSLGAPIFTYRIKSNLNFGDNVTGQKLTQIDIKVNWKDITISETILGSYSVSGN